MIDVPVSSAMVERAPLIAPTATTAEAAELLRDPETPALFIEDDGELLGVVAESDIVATVAEGKKDPVVREYMSTPVQSVGPQLPIGLAADKMRDTGVMTLPVVEDGYRGLVTVDHLAPYLPRHRLEVTWDGEPIRLSES